MKNYKISNGEIELTVSSKGAEPMSIIDKKTGCELLWQGDPEIWADRAILLFPVIGRLKDRKYTLDGKEFEIDPHGFAASCEFSVTEQAQDSITFTLTDNEETLAQYPLSFRLSVTFTLSERSIIKRHQVKNNSEAMMYYGVGGHEGFRLDFTGDETLEDYELYFENTEALELITADSSVMLNEKREFLSLNNGVLPISMETFKNDALIFDDVTGRKAAIRHRERGTLVSVDFADFKYFGVWTRYIPGICKYLCLEPWSTLPDCNYLGCELEKKLGIRTLPAGAAEELTYTINL